MHAGVDSLDKLEIVVALHRAPDRASTFSALRAKLGLDRDELRRSLRELAAAGLVADGEADPVVLARASETDEAILSEIVARYAADKVPLAIAITEIALDRLRTMAARAFADAFVIRRRQRGEDDDG